MSESNRITLKQPETEIDAEIESWILGHSFSGPSINEKRILSDRYTCARYNRYDVCRAGVFAYTKAQEAFDRNLLLRLELKLPQYPELDSEGLTKAFADPADLDTNKTMLLLDKERLFDLKVVDDRRHKRTVAAWAKVYHRATEQNAELRNKRIQTENKNSEDAILRKSGEDWFEHPAREHDKSGEESALFKAPGYTDAILKNLAVDFRARLQRSLEALQEDVDKSARFFGADNLYKPDTKTLFAAASKPDPDFKDMSDAEIFAWSLPQRRNPASANGMRAWDRFTRSLAVLAWQNCHVNIQLRRVRADFYRELEVRATDTTVTPRQQAQKWFDSPERASDREGKESTAEFHREEYTNDVLSPLACDGHFAVQSTHEVLRAEIAAAEEQVGRGKISAPDLRPIFEREPRPDPDLRTMAPKDILVWNLPRKRLWLHQPPESVQHRDPRATERWDNFTRSLAILAWEKAHLDRTIREVRQELYLLQSKARKEKWDSGASHSGR